MTFLCTVDGVLVAKEWPWPEPWAFRCDTCGSIDPYGSTLRPAERRWYEGQVREITPDTHRCERCEGWTDQLGLGL